MESRFPKYRILNVDHIREDRVEQVSFRVSLFNYSKINDPQNSLRRLGIGYKIITISETGPTSYGPPSSVGGFLAS